MNLHVCVYMCVLYFLFELRKEITKITWNDRHYHEA